jgi:acetyl-CoA acetyltransferase
LKDAPAAATAAVNGRRDVAIVGVAELSAQQILACSEPIEAAALALIAASDDATLSRPAEIDALLVYDSITAPHPMAASKLAEYLGLRPAYAAAVGAGGASPLFAVVLAAGLIELGAASTVAVVHADLRGGAARRKSVISRMASIVGHPQFEDPLGPTVVTLYALLADWLLRRGDATLQDLAEIAVSARAWAAANPLAHRRDPLNERDVLESPRVAGPLGRHDCCLITDLAGAVIVSAGVGVPGRDGARLLGTGGGVTHEEISQIGFDDPLLGARTAAQRVYAAAGLTPAEIDAAYLYDSFTVTVALQLLAYGLDQGAGLGELLRRVGTRPGGGLPVNTHGGLLSAVTGGLSHLIEAVRQLRGEAGERQLPGIRNALVTGVGGVFSHHCALIVAA